MAINRLNAVASLLGLGALLTLGSAARTQQQATQPDPSAAQPTAANTEGMEVLARGPIHEAYAEPVDYQPKATKVVAKQPPDPIDEVPPDQKPAGDNVQWIPGYWASDDDRNDFVWVSGIWRIPPPDRQWVPGHWDQAEGGWQWTPGFWQVAAQDQIEYLPPPPEPPEGAAAASTPAPSDDSVYIPGSYVYRDTRYAWRPGYWVDYRPGWVWIPAHYVWTPSGYVFVEGYWDYEFDRRGLLFAPVYFTERLWLRPRWYFQPAYAVYPDFILTALFLRPGYYSYYFGDYYDPAYRRGGFVSWLDYRWGRSGYDPLFTYYRWSYRDDPAYFRDLRGLYAARYSGQAPRPPRTLVQQTTVINNTTVNKTTTNIQNLTVLAPLAQMDRKVVRLQAVPQQQMTTYRQAAQQFRQVSSQRAQQERQLVARGDVPTKATDKPRFLKVPLPQTAAPARVEGRNQPPAPPVPPRSLKTPQTRPETGRQPVTPRPEGRQPTPQPKTEPRPQPKTEPRPQPQPAPRPQPKAEPKPQPQPAPRPQPKAEPRPQPRPEPKPQPKPEPKQEAKPPSLPPQPVKPGSEAPKPEHKK